MKLLFCRGADNEIFNDGDANNICVQCNHTVEFKDISLPSSTLGATLANQIALSELPLSV
jgi:tRNA U34 2-thiouridine synthase MnmA/TrmU